MKNKIILALGLIVLIFLKSMHPPLDNATVIITYAFATIVQIIVSLALIGLNPFDLLKK